jgi:hypothetical protein
MSGDINHNNCTIAEDLEYDSIQKNQEQNSHTSLEIETMFNE